MPRPLFRTLAFAALALAACGKTTTVADGGDAGLANICNDPASALVTPACQLAISPAGPDGGIVGTPQEFYLDHVGKQLWLSVQLPATLPPRALFQLVAGYGVPSTPVSLTVNLISGDQKTSIASGVDKDKGGPKPVELLVPTPAPSTQWFVEVTDASGLHDDVHSPFIIYADIVSDSDTNIPGTPTPITLSGGSGVQTGACANGPCQGVLSVTGRVDEFSVTVPTSIARPILYLNVAAPSTALNPPPAYRLGYELDDSAGTQVTTDHISNPFLDLGCAALGIGGTANDAGSGTCPLSTAQLVKPGETYTVKVKGYNTLTGLPAPGDLRLTYTLTTEVMPDVDVNEPNDLLAVAHSVSFGGAPSSQTVTGRLSYIGDSDWYALKIPAMGMSNARLHYKVLPTKTGGRYPPILGTALIPLPYGDRVSELSFLIPDQGPGVSLSACEHDPNSCPQDVQTPPGSPQQQLQMALCSDGDGDGGALCLLSEREEQTSTAAGFTDISNFEGIIPVQGGAAQTLDLWFHSASGTFADDLDYTLQLDLEQEGPENQGGYHTTQGSALSFGTLGAGTTQSGLLSTGYGYLNQYNLTELPPVDVRGPIDYDAQPSTTDVWQADFPSSYVGNPGLGATWQLSWTVSSPATESLVLEVQFCGANGCSVSGPNGPAGLPGALAYSSVAYLPWYNPSGGYTGGSFGLLFGESGATGGGYTVTVEPVACFCFEPEYLSQGKFYVTVVGADRTAWTDTPYSLTMGISSYPESFTIADAGGFDCPTPNADAGITKGCGFINGLK